LDRLWLALVLLQFATVLQHFCDLLQPIWNIFATHLHEIIDYDEIKSLKNVALKHMSVIYDKERDCLIYDRKLKDGPGTNMYGLEVCKSLSLPQDFLEAALNIRMKYHPTSASILSLKTSHFNSKKVVGMCELCEKEPGKEVHNLQHQMLHK
jgi:DNA mismatch repair protein MutS